MRALAVIIVLTFSAGNAFADPCKNACNKKCDDAKNKSKCVAECRRACDGK